MKVKSLGSNKTELKLDDLLILISYETPVAAIRLNAFKTNNPNAAIKTNKFWSVTTSKHINQWLKSHNFALGDIPEIDQDYFDHMLD